MLAAGAVAVAALAAVVLTGVLGGDPEPGEAPIRADSSATSTSAPTDSAMSGKTFYKKADEICVAGEEAVRALGVASSPEQAISIMTTARKVAVGVVAAYENLGVPRTKKAGWGRYVGMNRQGIEVVDKLILDLQTGGRGAPLYLQEMEQLSAKAGKLERSLGLRRCAKTA